MRKVFADTSYFIAMLNRQDQWHEEAKAAFLKLNPFHLVTSEMVFVELLNAFGGKGTSLRKKAVLTIEHLQNAQDATVAPQTAEQFQHAVSSYKQHEDKSWGLTDCSSILIMRQQGLTEVLTSDRHFTQAGMTVLIQEERR